MRKPHGVALVPLIAVISGLLALGLIATVVVLTVTSSNTANSNSVACTDEAKLCPDGSYVGRSGPNCEFAECPTTPNTNLLPPCTDEACPSEENTNDAAGWRTYSNTTEGFSFQYPANQYTTPELQGTSYARIQNYSKDKEVQSLLLGEWYIEMVMTTLDGSVPCEQGLIDQQSYRFGTMTGFRGQAEVLGGEPGGDIYLGCVERNSQRYILNVTVHPDDATTANAILDTFSFTN